MRTGKFHTDGVDGLNYAENFGAIYIQVCNVMLKKHHRVGRCESSVILVINWYTFAWNTHKMRDIVIVNGGRAGGRAKLQRR